MPTNRHKPEEIVSKLRQVEVLVGKGMSRSHFFPIGLFRTAGQRAPARSARESLRPDQNFTK